MSLLLLAGLLFPSTSIAQDDVGEPSIVRIVLVNGTAHVGRIVSENDTTIVLETDAGVQVTIPRRSIRSITTVTRGRRGGTVMRPDPNQTRLLFSPTARPVGHGQGYLALYEIFFPFVSVGVGNVATLSGGFSLLPGVSEQLLYAAPKVTAVNSGNTSIAVGGFAATLTGSGGYGGIAYGVITQGSSYAAVTGGVGFLFGEGEFVDTPIFLIGGEYQVSSSIKLLTENYIVPEVENAIIFSAGVRFIGDNLSADFGLFGSPDTLGESGFPFLPWIGFSYAWR